MAIYTRTGDRGQTSLFNGQRVSKSDLRVETYGTIDELNSAIGVAIAQIRNPSFDSRSGRPELVERAKSEIRSELIRIQKDLFEIGSVLASPGSGNLGHLSNRTKDFENLIDKMTESLPSLSNFILPGGGKTGALLHFARTVARRAERKIVALSEKDPSAGHSTLRDEPSGSDSKSSGHGKVDNNIIMYLNRLSDLLFTMARFVNYKEKQKETIWVKK